MDRRGFLKGMLALGAAPAIVRVDSLMRIIPLNQTLTETVLEDLVAKTLVIAPTKLIIPKELWPGVKAFWGERYSIGIAHYDEVFETKGYLQQPFRGRS